MYIAFEKELTELFKFLNTSYLLVELRVHREVEVIIYLIELRDVFVLHLSACSALPARVICLGEANLVDNNVVNIDFELSQLNC